MTTLVALTLNNSASPPFSYVFTLDSASYTGSVTWNVYAQRWYFTLQDQLANVVWNGPLVGSPLDYDIPLAPGIFTTSTILWREDTGNFEVSP
ncbi:hypothetical protein [Paraburkholderia acidisoli]|uniref:Uncharacterized protein n=1 Tax=Paraburkholderia acidisoli TaxID=2571748 RepID=A0A7Z2GQY5_9BURK|nr:hypothetical protein [Paraburkholderia acidisoli]QGZ66267.1 hypothetical protein FAZ98_31190 [Paraburkholderia acidisoli]QGZ66354.1 hypothetical protein FAZ98_31680 [Paraburkholderia acidisoli]